MTYKQKQKKKLALEQKYGWIAGWEKKQKVAQMFHFIEDEKTGERYKRIKYGEEEGDWGANIRRCHDCGVKKGQYHVFGCDVERSPIPSEKGSQLLMSDRAGNYFIYKTTGKEGFSG